MKNMRSIFSVFISLILMFTIVGSISAAAAKPVSVYVDGNLIVFNTDPIQTQGTTLVQFTPIFKALGLTFVWDQKTKTVTANKEGLIIKLTINNKIAVVNNEKKTLTVAPRIVNGNTFIPLRFVSEATGKTVSIDPTGAIFIGKKPTELSYDVTKLGSIKGVVTWQYNKLIGTKADVGASVALIPTQVEEKLNNTLYTLLLQSVPQGSDGIYTAKVDGFGDYNIDDVPAGDYYLLFVSSNTMSDGTIYKSDEVDLKTIFEGDSWDQLENKFKLYQYELRRITIKENKTLTESHDFGYTYI
jgi:hypothetical protein